MATLNPLALNLWILGGAIGYAVGQGHGLAIGVAVSAGITFVLSLFGK